MFRTLISAQDLFSHLDRCCVFDCRFSLGDASLGERQFKQGHIPGAHYLDLNEELSSPVTPTSGRHPLPDPQHLAARLQVSGLQPGKQAVVYDDAGGAMAARAWWLLRWLGHQEVAVLDGGLPAWQQGGFPLEAGVSARRTDEAKGVNSWSARVYPDAKQVVDSQSVLAALGSPDFTLVDARAKERFTGEAEPIDSKGGHVPGALNRPLQDNLRDGRFKPADELRKEWLQFLGERDPATVVHMCGSGVTACHNQLAMEMAGLGGSRVYTGSWSEWIRDPERPIATGAG